MHASEMIRLKCSLEGRVQGREFGLDSVIDEVVIHSQGWNSLSSSG